MIDMSLRHRTGMNISINSVVLVAIGLVVLGATGVLVGTSQADTADTADQIASDAQCDTWATQSTTAGNPDEADNAEQQYNENCEGNLDELADSNDFIGGNYDRDDNEDGGLVGGRNPDITPSTQVSGSYSFGEGETVTVGDEAASCTNLGRDESSLAGKTYVRCSSGATSGGFVTGSATGNSTSSGCEGNVVSGIPISQGDGNAGTSLAGDCAHSGIINTAEGERKLALCEYVEIEDQSTSEGTVEVLRVSIGDPNSASAQICQSGSSTGDLGGDIDPNTDSGDTDSTGSGNSDTSDGSDGTSSSGTSDTSDSSGSSTTSIEDVAPGAVGGGADYQNKVCGAPSGAQTVSSASGLVDAVSSASSGSTVYVEGSANIDMTDEDVVEVPSGVAVASNRGCSGSSGATLTDDAEDEDEPIFRLASDTRLTGMTLIGYGSSDEPHDRDEVRAMGVEVEGDNAELDNMRIDNFVGRCVVNSGDSFHAHHNTITYCNKLGYGYLIYTSGEDGMFESNYFNHYRHAIASNGGDDMSWTARYNIVGPDRQNHDFDVHGDEDGGDSGTAGEYIEIYGNTFEGERTYSDNGQPHIDIRGMPASDSVIRNNWYQNLDYDTYSPVVVDEEDIFEDEDVGTITIEDNHRGTDEPSCDIGAPREGCSTSTGSSGSN